MRFNMMKLGMSSAAALLASSAALASHYDFTKINQSIAEATKGVLAAQSDVKNLTISLDPEATNPEADQYKANMAFQVAGFDGLKGDVDVNATKTVFKDKEGNLHVQGSIKLHGDSVALTHLSATHKAKKICALAAKSLGFNKLILSEDCRVLTQLSGVQTYEEIVTAMKEHISNHTRDLTAFVAESDGVLKGLANSAIREEIVQSREKASKLLTALKDAKIVDNKASFSVSIDALDLGIVTLLSGVADLATIESAAFEITPDSFGFSFEMKSHLLDKIYKYAKPEILRMFDGLVADDACAKEILQAKLRIFLNVVSDLRHMKD